jgi:hypothetical protein
MERRRGWISALVIFAAAIPLPAQLLEQRRIPLHGSTASGEFEARFQAPGEDQWVRLVPPLPKEVRVNGTLVVPTERDRLTRSIALSPYLRPRAANRLQMRGLVADDQPPAVEVTPRVFTALVTRAAKAVRFTVANTLENASNVQVRWGQQAVSASVPPESLADLEMAEPPRGGREAILTKFAESLEAGYEVRVVLPPI